MKKSITAHVTSMNNSGFTLIEMVAVLLLVGILGATATGKFIDLWSDAERAAVANIGANFTTGVNYVHFKWLASGSPGAVLDFMPVTSATGSGALSVNANGWPADMRGTSRTLNSNADCVDVWVSVFLSGPSVSDSASTADYQAIYNGSYGCTYAFQKNTELNIQFNSITGQVTISD